MATDIAIESGRPSLIGLAKQVAQGTQNTTITNTINANAGAAGTTNTRDIIEYDTMNGTLDVSIAQRGGVEDTTAKIAMPFDHHQGLPLLKALVQTDTMSGASATSFTTTTAVALTVGQTIIPFTGPAPSVPTGWGEWTNAFVTIDTGANAETVPIWKISGTNLYTWPLHKAHAVSVALSVPVQHCLLPAVGTSLLNWDWYSLFFRYGIAFERQLTDTRVTHFNLTGDARQLTATYDLVSDAILPPETTTLSTYTAGTGEGTDNSWVQPDGGIGLRYAQADVACSLHNRLTALTYDIQHAVDTEHTNAAATQHALGGRTQTMTFRELLGQNGALPTIRTEFVKTQTPTELFMSYVDASNSSYGISIWLPRVFISMYDPIDPNDPALGFNCTVAPKYDAVSGKAVKVNIYNSATTSY